MWWQWWCRWWCRERWRQPRQRVAQRCQRVEAVSEPSICAGDPNAHRRGNPDQHLQLPLSLPSILWYGAACCCGSDEASIAEPHASDPIRRATRVVQACQTRGRCSAFRWRPWAPRVGRWREEWRRTRRRPRHQTAAESCWPRCAGSWRVGVEGGSRFLCMAGDRGQFSCP